MFMPATCACIWFSYTSSSFLPMLKDFRLLQVFCALFGIFLLFFTYQRFSVHWDISVSQRICTLWNIIIIPARAKVFVFFRTCSKYFLRMRRFFCVGEPNPRIFCACVRGLRNCSSCFLNMRRFFQLRSCSAYFLQFLCICAPAPGIVHLFSHLFGRVAIALWRSNATMWLRRTPSFTPS